MKKTPVIIDCDPGLDDAIALVLAFAAAEFDIKAVTVCAGNVGLDDVVQNARKILGLLGQSVSLAAGAAKPMFREPVTAVNIHGPHGLYAPTLTNTDYPVEQISAVALMRRIITESPEPVTIIATGPLTNLGFLFRDFPEVEKNISLVSFMGGSLDGGNHTAAAEFNFYADPEAANIVLSSGIPLVMSGLNVTRKALIMKSEIDALRAMGSPVSVFAADLLDYYLGTNLKLGYKGAALHDPCAVACLIRPDLFDSRPYHVVVETTGTHTAGMSLADTRPYSTAKPNVTVNTGVDREGLISLLADAAESYRKTPIPSISEQTLNRR
jgi:pyrimidine-specific ribonucleoside hydrolase